MPNIRLRQSLAKASPFTLVLRPLLAIGAVIRTSAGVIMSQADVVAFNRLTDLPVARDISDNLGRYGASVPDAQAYYTVAIQGSVFSSTIVTWDNQRVTFDRTKSIGGVSAEALVGVS